jgi:DNA-directed RNA polymerase subunit H (RpoH/RPB5)
MSEKEEEIDIFQISLVPKHILLTEDEKAALLKQYNVTLKQLPRIKVSDPAVKRLGGKKGDIVKIIRTDETVGDYNYYRVVVS